MQQSVTSTSSIYSSGIPNQLEAAPDRAGLLIGEYSRLRAENSSLLEKNQALAIDVAEALERGAAIGDYARQLERLLDESLERFAPEEYWAQKQAVAFHTNDMVHLSKAAAYRLFGGSIPHILDKAFSEGQTEFTVMPESLVRVGITNFEQLNLLGIGQFSVSRASE